MTRTEWMRRAGCCAILFAAISPLAQALEIELGSGIGAEYTTNVLRSENNEQDELIGNVWAGASLIERSPTLTAEVAAAADAQTYLNDTVSDDVLFSLASAIDWAILPQRFIWHLEDYYQQSQVSPLEPAGPDNRQDTNVFWTGPDVLLRLAQLYTVELGARYGDYYYADTAGDNTRLAGMARLTRRLSEINSIYLQASQTQVEYDQPGAIGVDGVPNSDFDRTDAFAGWMYESVLTELRLELGATRIERETLQDTDGLLGALTVRRRLPREGSIGLRVLHQYTEGGGDLLLTGGGRLGAASADTGITQDIAYERFAEIFYDDRWGGAQVNLRLYRRAEDYEVALLDRTTYGLRAEAGYRLAPAWRGNVYGAYRNRDYDLLTRTDHDVTVGLGASYLMTRRLTADFDVHHNARESDAGTDFNESVAIISLRYGQRPAWSER